MSRPSGSGGTAAAEVTGDASVGVARVGGRTGRLGPREIRSKRFSGTRFGRRGLDPEEVRRFLGLVAAEVVALRAEVAGAREESRRVRAVLREWQTWYGARVSARADRRAGSPPNHSGRYDP